MTVDAYHKIMKSIFSEKLSNTAPSVPRQAEKMGLVALGGNAYGPDPKGPTTHLNIDGKLVKVDSPEAKRAEKQKSIPKRPISGPDRKIDPTNPRVRPEPKTPSMTQEEFSSALKFRLNDSLQKLDSSPTLKSMKSEFAPEFRKFYGRLDDISKMRPGRMRREELESFVELFSMVMGQSKLYANVFSNKGGLYKVFGNTLSRDAQYFLQLLQSEGINLTESTDSKNSAKQYLSGQSKPDYGKPHNINDPNVNDLFKSDPALSALPVRYKSVFGPSDKNGQLLQSGGKNANAYFQHSVFANQSVDKSIEALDQLASALDRTGKIGPNYIGVANALRAHRSHMKRAAKLFDSMAPRAREELVGQIYAQLAEDMHTADAEVASSIMKNMSESALYDTEIAAGKEVYLPADGTFPGGDKIVVTRKGTKIEHIQAISVKYGQNSKHSYGMAAGASTLGLYHPDPTFRDLVANRAGRAGYEVGVNGTVIHDSNQFKLMAKLSGFNEVFSQKQLEDIRVMGVELTQITKSFKKKRSKSPNGELTAQQLGGIQNDPSMQAAWKKLRTLLQNGNQKKFIELVGEYNYSQIMKQSSTGQESMQFYSYMCFGAVLKTSDGLSTIVHNKQEYKNGKFFSETTPGSANLFDWQGEAVMYGLRGGGLRMGYNPAGRALKSRTSNG